MTTSTCTGSYRRKCVAPFIRPCVHAQGGAYVCMCSRLSSGLSCHRLACIKNANLLTSHVLLIGRYFVYRCPSSLLLGNELMLSALCSFSHLSFACLATPVGFTTQIKVQSPPHLVPWCLHKSSFIALFFKLGSVIVSLGLFTWFDKST